ncbi:MAG: CpsB/CapC family capsule biosynthesis tyrosine phosphatase, partial [Eubacterium sp.]
QDFLYRLQAKGYSTILAHPERYDFVREDPNILLDFMDKGTYIQTNALSLIGFYGSGSKETAEIMLEHDMVQFLASDAHRVKSYELMEKALNKAEEIIGKNKLGQIMNYNPAMVLGNKDKIQCTPIEYNPKKKHHFFPALKRQKKKRLGEVGI